MQCETESDQLGQKYQFHSALDQTNGLTGEKAPSMQNPLGASFIVPTNTLYDFGGDLASFCRNL